ncbi:MAG: NHLP leader peptide family RiPP precursor [Vicinamibacterales bacterium]
MSQKMTRGEIQDLVSKFAAESPKYRQALISNPKATIEKQLGTSLGSTNIKAVVETADTAYVVIPHVPAEGELSDADLEKVAGGFLDKNAECNNSPGVMNTFVQINL